jgi:transposase
LAVYYQTPSKANAKLPASHGLTRQATLKHFRAIATHYDKLARNFLAAIQLACAIILLN